VILIVGKNPVSGNRVSLVNRKKGLNHGDNPLLVIRKSLLDS